MTDYLPLVFLVGFSAIFVGLMVVMSLIIGPKRFGRVKNEVYECGIEQTPQPAGGGRFVVKYFIIAMIFIVFDIEVIFLYPAAVAFGQLGLFGLVEILVFIATVLLAYIYVWRRGGLDWE